jgi:hypothetical protein
MSDNPQAPMTVLDNLIRKAGGITSLAASLGMTEGGIRYWQKKKSVPEQAARLLSYEAAAKWGMDIKPEDLTGGK